MGKDSTIQVNWSKLGVGPDSEYHCLQAMESLSRLNADLADIVADGLQVQIKIDEVIVPGQPKRPLICLEIYRRVM